MPDVHSPHGVALHAASLCTLGLLSWSISARAQLAQEPANPFGATGGAIGGEFSVQRFSPAPGPRNFLSTRGARTDGTGAWTLSVLAHYAKNPLIVQSCSSVNNCDAANPNFTDIHVVENLATFDAMLAFTPVPKLQLGLRIPIAFVEGDGLTADGTPNFEDPLEQLGPSDPELEIKARVLGEAEAPFVLGVAGFVTAPLGNTVSEGNYLGESKPTFGGFVIADAQFGLLSLAANLGGAWRDKVVLGSTELGPELRYSGAAQARLSPVVALVASGFGSSRLRAENGANAFELEGALRLFPVPNSSQLSVSVGGGSSLIRGVGAPSVRGLVEIAYSFESVDRDGDGLRDSLDQCVTSAEDFDGFQDDDGCPELDNDDDGLPDAQDQCPAQPEDVDGTLDGDGCPELDNDSDGVPDLQDRCPTEPETVNHYDDEDGCPDAVDTDKDGVPDDRDRCLSEPEDTDGFEDTDGCPEADNDKDGILDTSDECSDEPETVNGKDDEDGCPD